MRHGTEAVKPLPTRTEAWDPEDVRQRLLDCLLTGVPVTPSLLADAANEIEALRTRLAQMCRSGQLA